jgi:hypothetical protein
MLLPACSGKKSVAITYELQQTVYYPGEKIVVLASVQNTGSAIRYIGDHTESATLFLNDGSESYYIHSKNDVHNDDATEYVFNKGATYDTAYAFVIPEDALPGQYNMKILFEGTETIFENVLEIRWEEAIL